MESDLDITNYSLEDLLDLFQLPVNFNESQLKRAKRCVLQIHPDKSNLPHEYFLFYSKAYKMIYSIWEFRKQGTSEGSSTEYETLLNENKNKALLDKFFEANEDLATNNKKFNDWFNSEFDNQMQKENDGYGEWLQQKEEKEEKEEVTFENFHKRKAETRALVVCGKEIDEPSSSDGNKSFSFVQENQYNSSLYSSLPYQDLKQAYTETIIPVTEEEDFNKVRKFQNVNELMTHRTKQDTTPLSEQHAKLFLQQKSKQTEEISTQVAYDLNKKTEMAYDKNKVFWSKIQALK
jgi:hypothetical protein